MDELNLYDDLDEFQEQHEKKSKELQNVEEKHQQSLKTIEQLQGENRILKTNIQRIELGFQSLLDTARSEIKRKDKEIDRLRKEKDDICFRRKIPSKTSLRESVAFPTTTYRNNEEKANSYKRHRSQDDERDQRKEYKRTRNYYDDKYQHSFQKHSKTSKKYEEYRRVSDARYKGNRRESTSQSDYNRNRDYRDSMINNSEDSSDKYSKSSKSSEHDFKSPHKSRTRERDKDEKKHKNYERNRSQEDKNSHNSSKSTSRKSKLHLDTDLDKNSRKSFKKTESGKTRKTFDDDLGEEKNKILTAKISKKQNIEKTANENRKCGICKESSIPKKQAENKEAEESSNVILKEDQVNKNEKISDEVNENNVQLEIKTGNSSTTETSKLYTPRKVAFFNRIFGKSPTECSSTPINMINLNSLLNNIKDIIPKSSQIKVVSSDTTSPSNYTDINSSCMSTPINKTIEIISSSSSTPGSTLIIDNGPTTATDEIDNCFIPNRKSDEHIETIACVDLTNVSKDDNAIDDDFIEIPGLDLCKSSSIQIDESSGTTANKVASETEWLTLNKETTAIEVKDKEMQGMNKTSVTNVESSVTIDKTTPYNKELSHDMNVENVTESIILIKPNLDLQDNKSNNSHSASEKTFASLPLKQDSTKSKDTAIDKIFGLSARAQDISDNVSNKFAIIEALSCGGTVSLKNPYKTDQIENELKSSNNTAKLLKDSSSNEMQNNITNPEAVDPITHLTEDSIKETKKVEVNSQTKLINSTTFVENTILMDKSEANKLDKGLVSPVVMETQADTLIQNGNFSLPSKAPCDLNAKICLVEKQSSSAELELLKAEKVLTLQKISSTHLTEEPEEKVEIIGKELSANKSSEKEKEEACKRILDIEEDVLNDIEETVVELRSPAKVVEIEGGHVFKLSESTSQEESLSEEKLDKVVQIIELPSQTKDLEIGNENLISTLEQGSLYNSSEKSKETKSVNNEASVVKIAGQEVSSNLMESAFVKDKPLTKEKIVEIIQTEESPKLEKEYEFSTAHQDNSSVKDKQSVKVFGCEEMKSINQENLNEITASTKIISHINPVQVEKEKLCSITEHTAPPKLLESNSAEENLLDNDDKLIKGREIAEMPSQTKNEQIEILSTQKISFNSAAKCKESKVANKLDQIAKDIELFSPAKVGQLEEENVPSIAEQNISSKLPERTSLGKISASKCIRILRICKLSTQIPFIETLSNSSEEYDAPVIVSCSEESKSNNLNEITETIDLVSPTEDVQVKEKSIASILLEKIASKNLPTQEEVVQIASSKKEKPNKTQPLVEIVKPVELISPANVIEEEGKSVSTILLEKIASKLMLAKKEVAQIASSEKGKPNNKEKLVEIVKPVDLSSLPKDVQVEDGRFPSIEEHETSSKLPERFSLEEKSLNTEKSDKFLSMNELSHQAKVPEDLYTATDKEVLFNLTEKSTEKDILPASCQEPACTLTKDDEVIAVIEKKANAKKISNIDLPDEIVATLEDAQPIVTNELFKENSYQTASLSKREHIDSNDEETDIRKECNNQSNVATVFQSPLIADSAVFKSNRGLTITNIADSNLKEQTNDENKLNANKITETESHNEKSLYMEPFTQHSNNNEKVPQNSCDADSQNVLRSPDGSLVLNANQNKESTTSICVEVTNKESIHDQDHGKSCITENKNKLSTKIISKEININGEIVEVVKDIVDLNEAQIVSGIPCTKISLREVYSLERVLQQHTSHERNAVSSDKKASQNKVEISKNKCSDIDTTEKRNSSTEDRTTANKNLHLINKEIQYAPTQLQQTPVQTKANPDYVLQSSPTTLSEAYDTIPILPSISTTSPTPSNFSGIFSKNSSTEIANEDELSISKKKSLHLSAKPKEYILLAASVLCNVDNLKNATKSSKKLHWELLDNKNETAEIEDDVDIDTTDDDLLKIKEEPLETVSTCPKQNSMEKNLTNCNPKKSSPSETDTQTEDDFQLHDLAEQRRFYKKKKVYKDHNAMQCKDKLSKNFKSGLNVIEMRNTESLEDDTHHVIVKSSLPNTLPKVPVGRLRKQDDNDRIINEKLPLHRKKRGHKPKNISENLKLQQQLPRKIISSSKLDNYKESQVYVKEDIQNFNSTASDELKSSNSRTNYDDVEQQQHKVISTESLKPHNHVENSNGSLNGDGKNIPKIINCLENSMKILSNSVERLEICDDSCSSKDSIKQRKSFKIQDSSTSDNDTFVKKDIAVESNNQLKERENLEVKQLMDRNNVSPKSLIRHQTIDSSGKESQNINLINSGDKLDVFIAKDKVIDKTNVLPITDICSGNVAPQENSTISRDNSETDNALSNKQQELQKDKSLTTKPLFKKKYKSMCYKNKVANFISLQDIGIKVRPLKLHLSSFRIPKIRKDPEDTIDNSWKLETYVEPENETNREQLKQHSECEKNKIIEKYQQSATNKVNPNLPKEDEEKSRDKSNKVKIINEKETSKSSPSSCAINFGKTNLFNHDESDATATRATENKYSETSSGPKNGPRCDSYQAAASNSLTKPLKKSINLHRKILDSSSDEENDNEVKITSMELNKNSKKFKLETNLVTSSKALSANNAMVRRKSMYVERSTNDITNEIGDNQQPINAIKSFKMGKKLIHLESTSLKSTLDELQPHLTPENLIECNKTFKKPNTELLSTTDGNKNLKDTSKQIEPIRSLKMRRKSMYVESMAGGVISEQKIKTDALIAFATDYQNSTEMRKKSINIDRGSWNIYDHKNDSVECKMERKRKGSSGHTQQTNTGSDSSNILQQQRPISSRRKSTNQTQNTDLSNKNSSSFNSQEDKKSNELNNCKEKARKETNELKSKIDKNQKMSSGVDCSIVKSQNQVVEAKLITDHIKLNDFTKTIHTKSNDMLEISEKNLIKHRRKSINECNTSHYCTVDLGSKIGRGNSLNELMKNAQNRSNDSHDTTRNKTSEQKCTKKRRMSSIAILTSDSSRVDAGATIDAGKLREYTDEQHKDSHNNDKFFPKDPNLAKESEKQLIKNRRKSTSQSFTMDLRNTVPGSAIDTIKHNNFKEINKQVPSSIVVTQTKRSQIHDSSQESFNSPITCELNQQMSIKIRRISTSQCQPDVNQPDSTNELNHSQQKLQETTEASKSKNKLISISKVDSDSSVTVAQQKSITLRRKSTNQRRILDSSTDDDEPLVKKTTVIKSEVINPLIPISKPKQRRKRVVKVLSTSYDMPANVTNVSQNSSPNHPIFNTEVSAPSTEFPAYLPVTPSQQDYKKFNEIDSKLHEIFQSPTYTADYKIAPAVDAGNQTFLPPPTNEFLPNLTINETVDFNRENDKTCLNVSQVNESKKSSAHNNSEIKHLSLGSADYRFEKVSDNVINLFISRKRRRKNNNTSN